MPFGKGTVAFTLPPGTEREWIHPQSVLSGEGRPPGDLIISMALSNPIGSPCLRELAQGKESAVILISDISRLCPSYLFLEALLNELNAGGISDACICIVVALGMHRRQTEDELRLLAGEAAFRRVRVLNHSPLQENCVDVGITSRGTPVAVNRIVAEAGLRIATGNLEPHRLAGISGGAKALVPGAAAHKTIEANHALSQYFHTSPGETDNTVRIDLEEAQSFVPIHFIFNVIVNAERELLAAYAGDVIAAHRAGAEAVRALFVVGVRRTYPVVIASAGGHPKDAQLYQTVKTLQNAAQIAAPGGVIFLIAECSEQFGNGLFQYWLETFGDRAQMVARLQKTFTLGPHKIEHIDKVLQKNSVYFYSRMPEPLAELTGLHPVRDLQSALTDRISRVGGPVAIMPHGALTFPASKTSERSSLYELEPLVP